MPDYEFTCGSCGAVVAVDEGARRLLLEDGCVACGAVPTEAAFSAAGDPGGDPP